MRRAEKLPVGQPGRDQPGEGRRIQRSFKSLPIAMGGDLRRPARDLNVGQRLPSPMPWAGAGGWVWAWAGLQHEMMYSYSVAGRYGKMQTESFLCLAASTLRRCSPRLHVR